MQSPPGVVVDLPVAAAKTCQFAPQIVISEFYAGGYAYGKSEKRTALVDGRVRTTYKHRKPFERWEALIRDHHEGYIDWDECERNQKVLAANAYGKAGGAKCGRGGRALLPELLLCGGCGCRLVVAYSGHYSSPFYRCERPHQMLGRPRCLTFGAKRIDVAIGGELIFAVAPMAIEAALYAEHRVIEQQSEQQRIVELEHVGKRIRRPTRYAHLKMQRQPEGMRRGPVGAHALLAHRHEDPGTALRVPHLRTDKPNMDVWRQDLRVNGSPLSTAALPDDTARNRAYDCHSNSSSHCSSF